MKNLYKSNKTGKISTTTSRSWAKIHKADKVKKKQLNSIKQRGIKGFYIDSQRQLLQIVWKKRDITKPQVLIYDTSNNMKRIDSARDYNSWKNIYPQIKK